MNPKKEGNLKKDGISIDKGYANPKEDQTTIYFDVLFNIDYRTISKKELKAKVRKISRSIQFDDQLYFAEDCLRVLDFPDGYDDNSKYSQNNPLRSVGLGFYLHQRLNKKIKLTPREREQTAGWLKMLEYKEKIKKEILELQASLQPTEGDL